MFQKMKKNKILRNAFKKADEPIWFVYYESNSSDGTVKVFASSEREARDKAAFLISDIVNGADFVITGTAVI
nr:MAG TPA: hypothetical protein [Caudoviricetes sp.]